MKGRSVLSSVLVLGLAVFASPALADFGYFQHNLINQTSDTSFDTGTGWLTISAPSNALSADDGFVTGLVTDCVVNLTTQVYSYNSFTETAYSSGGNFSLTFTYDGTTGYELSGPVGGMMFTIGTTSPTLSTIDGEGLWQAATKTLPLSGVWDDGGGMSSIDTLTIYLGADLTGWDWTSPIPDGETTYNIAPNDSAVPEPGTMLLMAAGLIGLRRRR